MLVAAQRAAEANAEWAQQRRRALVPYGGIFGGALSSAASQAVIGKIDEEEEEEGGAGVGVGVGAEGKEGKEETRGKGQARGKGKGQEQQEHERGQEQRENDAGTRRRKRARREEKVPRGVYEPHSGIVLCKLFFFPFFIFLSPLLFFLTLIYRPCL